MPPFFVDDYWRKRKKPKPAPHPLHPKPHHPVDLRAEIVKWMEWSLAHEPQIHYEQSRPIPVHARPGSLPLRTDCSGLFTVWYAWAGAHDPNGFGFNGAGWTGSLVTHGKEVIHPRPGDAAIFGPGNGHHVAGVLSVHGNTIWLVSHGQERGPIKILLTDEAKYQPPGIRFRSYLP